MPVTATPRDLLRDAVARHGSISAVARIIGYKRPSVSLYLAGRYPADPSRIEAAILAKLAGRVACPHLGRDIAGDDCRGFALRPMPMSDPRALRHWRACQGCPSRPKEADDAES